MKIGLMGCEFVSPNKGCEALTYSFLSILNSIDTICDDIVIYNFSGTDIGKVEDVFPKFKFINVAPVLKDLKFKYIRALKKCDVIFDATMGDSFSDIYSKNHYLWTIRNKKLAELLCKKYILLPQTYGPFKTAESEEMAKKILKKADAIFCRDALSQNLIKTKFGITNSILTTDMAFFLPYDSNSSIKQKDKINLGINISGLLYKGGFSSKNQFDMKINYKEFINNLVKHYSDDSKYAVHLIPHVIDLSDNAHDDDYTVCKSIKQLYPNCILAPIFENPVDAKSYISNMDIFIGSRMHSTIAAFSTGIPTIALSYSRKFEGLFENLKYNYVINGKSVDTDEAIKLAKKYIKDKQILLSEVNNSKMIVEKSKENFKNKIEEIIKSI